MQIEMQYSRNVSSPEENLAFFRPWDARSSQVNCISNSNKIPLNGNAEGVKSKTQKRKEKKSMKLKGKLNLVGTILFIN